MTTNVLSAPTPEVLMNKGVPTQFVQVRQISGGQYEAHPDGVQMTHDVKFTHSKLRSLEKTWGSMAKWEDAMNTQQVSTIVETLAMLNGWTEQRVDEAMIPGRLAEYRLAISAALSIAMGTDPKVTSKALAETLAETGAGPDAVSAFYEKTEPSTSVSSGSSGSVPASNGTSSGTSPQASSSPSSPQWQ